jgi:hypothetical protein
LGLFLYIDSEDFRLFIKGRDEEKERRVTTSLLVEKIPE